MKRRSTQTQNGVRHRILRLTWLGMRAGLAGGLAEILWISLYAVLTGTDAATIARGISSAMGLGATEAPVFVGIGIHMALAATLGIALAFALRPALVHLYGKGATYAIVVITLAGVWAANFLLILPLVSPAFVSLVPFQISLLSKLLFGLAVAFVLSTSAAVRLPDKRR